MTTEIDPKLHDEAVNEVVRLRRVIAEMNNEKLGYDRAIADLAEEIRSLRETGCTGHSLTYDGALREADKWQRVAEERQQDIVQQNERLAAMRLRYSEKTLELARLREAIGAALNPEGYERAQREGNYT